MIWHARLTRHQRRGLQVRYTGLRDQLLDLCQSYSADQCNLSTVQLDLMIPCSPPEPSSNGLCQCAAVADDAFSSEAAGGLETLFADKLAFCQGNTVGVKTNYACLCNPSWVCSLKPDFVLTQQALGIAASHLNTPEPKSSCQQACSTLPLSVAARGRGSLWRSPALSDLMPT